MYEYKSQKELYQGLLPAIRVKLKLLKKVKPIDLEVTSNDIWNYLKDNKWKFSIDLTLADMVNDILHTDNIEFINYKKLRGE